MYIVNCNSTAPRSRLGAPYLKNCIFPVVHIVASGNNRVRRLRQKFSQDLLFLHHRYLETILQYYTVVNMPSQQFRGRQFESVQPRPMVVRQFPTEAKT